MSVAVRVFLFCTIAFGLSWGYWIALLLDGQRVAPGSSASHLPGLMGPALAAFVIAAITEGRPGLKRLGAAVIRWPDRPGLAALAIVAPPLIAGLVFAAQAAAGTPVPPLAGFLHYPGLWGTLASPIGLVVVILLNGYGEEIGWRGWLFPTLEARLGAFAASLTAACIWMLWHLPLFWLNATMAALVGPMLAGWIVALTLGTFALSWLWRETGSLTVLAIWHVGYNLAVATPATQGMVAAVTSAAVMLWGAWIAWEWWRRPPTAAQPPRIATT